MVERAGPRNGSGPERFLEQTTGPEGYTKQRWRETLRIGVEDEALGERIRRATMTGRPFGSAEFTEELELAAHRRLRPRRAGRQKKAVSTETAQEMMEFQKIGK